MYADATLRITPLNCHDFDMAESPYNCPCCGYRTLVERGANETCDRCLWTDDGQDNDDADMVRGGPNHELSLTKARQNFARLGVIADRYLDPVKPPPASQEPEP
jgi:hypothetical protein